MACYAMYLRKSRKDLDAEQRGEEETLARHKRILTELAERMRLPIEEIYHEVVSGDTIAARPQMQRLLADIEAGRFAGVVVMEVERLARGDTIDQGIVAQTFKYTNTKIITPAKTYDPQNEADVEYFEFSLFMSRREYSAIRRRLVTGKLAAAREGRWVSSVPPYGYDQVKVPSGKGSTLAPNDAEAAIVQQIFAWYTGSTPRLGTTNIAHKLNELGIPTRAGGLWTTATIQGIVHNPVYIGKIRWNSRQHEKHMEGGRVVSSRPRNADCMIVDGLHPAIISMNAWEQAQINLRDNRPLPISRGKETVNPLAGLMVCGKCGRKMVRRSYQDRQMPSLICPLAECDNVSSDLDIVERRVIASLETELKRMSASGGVRLNPPVIEQAAIVTLSEELTTLAAQQDQIRNLLERGVYDVATYQDRNGKIEASIAEVKQSLQAAKKAVSKYEAAQQRVNALVPKIEKLLSLYWSESPAARNELLRATVERVIYTRETATRWKERDNFTLNISLRE